MDRAALWVKWRNDDGWDVPEIIGCVESEWTELSPLTQAEVRE